MDSNRIDRWARTLGAAGTSRRLLFGRFASGAVAAAIGTTAGGALAKDQGPKGDDNKGKGAKGDDNKGKGGKDPACRGEGHPCEGNQVCCEGLVCGPGGPGAANRCSSPAPAPTVAAVASYTVAVNCAFDSAADRTTCQCTGMAPSGAAAVRSVAVSSSAVCADVVGGDAALGTPGPAVGSTGFTSSDGNAVLILILSGHVTTGGTATYWCMTDAGTVPAQGPGLVRVQDDVSTTTGSIDVRAAACDVAAPGPQGYDWHGQCSRPAAQAGFALAPKGGGNQQTATASADGLARFANLAPGLYSLSQTNGRWCHAESDGVDASGNVVVKANARTTVWIFDCASGGGS
jgi:hypothetical protein